MKYTLRIITAFGIPVQIHWTFGFVLLWVLFIGFQEGLDFVSILFLIAFVLVMFFCVVLHEYGHALMARRYGVGTKDITLFPIGGIARLHKLPEKPMEEFMVAIAGPVVNICIALILVPIFLIVYYPIDLESFANSEGLINSYNFLPILILVNVVLAAFNLLPAFPMDGGRVARALLSIKLGRTRATQIASYLGQIMAVVFLFFAIKNGALIMGLIAVFIFITAAQEYRMVKFDELMKSYTVSDILRMQFTRLYETDSIQTAIQRFQHGLEKNFLVFNRENKLTGILQENILLQAIQQNKGDNLVSHFINNRFETVESNESLKSVYYKMYEKKLNIFPVFKEGILLGVVDISKMNDFMRSTSP